MVGNKVPVWAHLRPSPSVSRSMSSPATTRVRASSSRVTRRSRRAFMITSRISLTRPETAPCHLAILRRAAISSFRSDVYMINRWMMQFIFNTSWREVRRKLWENKPSFNMQLYVANSATALSALCKSGQKCRNMSNTTLNARGVQK